jgi:hypothetical protein
VFLYGMKEHRCIFIRGQHEGKVMGGNKGIPFQNEPTVTDGTDAAADGLNCTRSNNKNLNSTGYILCSKI